MAIYLDDSVQNYLDWLKNVKKAPYHTYRAYNIDLLQFLKYFLRNEKNELPSKDEIIEYSEEIKGKYGYSTYRRKITALRNFIAYLIDSGIDIPDPFTTISLPMPDVDFNVNVEYSEILELIDNLPEHEKSEIRDKLIFCLIAKSGLTVKQIRSLKLRDVNIASNQIVLSQSQMTFIDNQTIQLLEKYLQVNRNKLPIGLDDFLICNQEKLPLAERTINLIIEKLGKKVRFKKRLSPTILRRLFAKNLNDKNITKETIQMILGRKSRLVC